MSDSESDTDTNPGDREESESSRELGEDEDVDDVFKSLQMMKKARVTSRRGDFTLSKRSCFSLPLPPQSKKSSVKSHSRSKSAGPDNDREDDVRSKSSLETQTTQKSSTPLKTPPSSKTFHPGKSRPGLKSPPSTSSHAASKSSAPLSTTPLSKRSTPLQQKTPQRDSIEPDESGAVMMALKDVTSLLNTLVKRVEDNSKDIKSLKISLKESSASSSSSDTPKNRKVLPVVRVSNYF